MATLPTKTTVELGTHVRSLNSMYRDYGVGKIYKVRDGLCKVEFNPSVFSLPPFRSEYFILSLDEVEICPTPLERAKAAVVVLPDGSIDAELSLLAASRYSENESLPPQIERALVSLDKMDVEEAFHHAKAHVESIAQLWDWGEDVELIGAARVVTLPAI